MSAAAKKTIARGGGPPPTGRAKGNPFMTGAWEPVGAEHTNMDLTVTHGAIPHDLNGSFVRTGPNPRFPERHDQRRYHFFSGDAMVHGVELVGGSAHYRNRWVQTRGYRRDLATMGESVGQPAPEDFGKGTGGGNTAMLYHAGRCLALSEGTQGAWQLALPSLDTVGFFTYNDELKHAFTAHPKVCADTGELHFFGEKTAVFFRSSFVYVCPEPVLADRRWLFLGKAQKQPFCCAGYGANDVAAENDRDAHIHYSAVSRDGELQYKDVPVPFRRPIMAHDMALSRDHVIFFDMPLWDMSQPVNSDDATRFGVLPRGAPAEAVQWFEAAGCYGYHTANAWDDVEGAHPCVELIYCSSERFHFQRSNADSLFLHRAKPSFFSYAFLLITIILPRQARDRHEKNSFDMAVSCAGWRFDLTTGTVLVDEDLCDVACEFPVVNPAVVGLKTRYIWCGNDKCLFWRHLSCYEHDHLARQALDSAYGKSWRKRCVFCRANVLVSEPSPLSSNGIIKYDVEARDWVIHTFQGDRRGGECFFAPRKGGSGAEDDGYLLCYTVRNGLFASFPYEKQ